MNFTKCYVKKDLQFLPAWWGEGTEETVYSGPNITIYNRAKL